MTFIGEYNCKADSKFRISVPAQFRKVLSVYNETAWVVRRSAMDSCVEMFPLSVWNSSLDRLRGTLNPFNKKHSEFLREFCRGSQVVEMDSNGRVLLPRSILEGVGIDKEMTLAGVDNKIQVWNPEYYEQIKMNPDALSNLVQEIFNT